MSDSEAILEKKIGIYSKRGKRRSRLELAILQSQTDSEAVVQK